MRAGAIAATAACPISTGDILRSISACRKVTPPVPREKLETASRIDALPSGGTSLRPGALSAHVRRLAARCARRISAVVVPGSILLASLAMPVDATAEDRLENLGLHAWSVNDGLPNGVIRALAQTRDGHLWIGTHDGLVRFDGFDFRTYQNGTVGAIPNDSISALAATDDGALWIATHGGLVRHERRGNSDVWRPLQEAGTQSAVAIVPDGDAILLAGAKRGLQRLHAGRLEQLAPPAPTAGTFSGVLAVAGHDGSLWQMSPSLGLQRRRNGRIDTILPAAALGESGVAAMAQGRNGTVWLGLKNGSLIAVSADRVQRIPRPPQRTPDNIRTLLVDSSDRLWIGTVRHGLLRFSNGAFEHFPATHPLAHAHVIALLEDRERNLWVGTSQGLYRLRDVPVERLQVSGAWFDRSTWSVFATGRGDYWIATESDGLIHAKKRDARSYTAADGLGSNRIYAVIGTPDGKLWATPSLGGLRTLVDDRFAPLPGASELADESITMLFLDSRRRLWLGGFVADSLYFVEDGMLRKLALPRGIGHTAATSFAETANGDIWVGTYNAGLFRIGQNGLRRFTRADGLLGEYVSALHSDADDALWIAVSGAGLNRWTKARMDRLTAADGMPSSNVLSMLHDRSGNLWMCTGRGLFAIRIAETKNGRNPPWPRISDVLSFGPEEGMPNIDCNGSAQSITGEVGEGTLLFSMTRGAIMVDPLRAGSAIAPPPTRIVAVSLDDAPWNLGNALRIGPETRRIRMQFGAISLREPHRLRFRHRLEGFDRDWSAPTTSREAAYTKLSPGKYRFQVQAKIGENDWGAVATLPMVVFPPFHRSLPFYALMALVAALALAIAHRLALAQLRARNAVLAERSRIAREIHDTLAHGLLAIRLNLDAAKALVDRQPSEAKDFLDRARTLADESVQEAHRSVYALRDPSAGHRDVIQAIVHQIETLTMHAPLDVRIDAPRTGVAMDADRQHELLRLVREATTNAINHAMATLLTVRIQRRTGVLLIDLADDGRGFDTAPESGAPVSAHRLGLAGMRERAERLGAKLEIESHPGAGTRVRLTVPLHPGSDRA
jgi:signal transduction histidine kinase/ligand-binding sensor domain-containing protein